MTPRAVPHLAIRPPGQPRRRGRLALGNVVALLLVLPGPVDPAPVYRWVDDQGRVHYTDRAPESAVDAERITVQDPPPPDGDLRRRRDQQRRLLEAIEADRSRRQAEVETAREASRVRARNCERAQRALERLEWANLPYTVDTEGERHYLDDAERSRLLEALRRRSREWCNP